MAYDAATLEQKAVFNDTPDGNDGGIWASDTGPAADADGNIYVPTGNGTFDAASGGRDYGDSVLKLTLRNSTIAISDYFTPYDQEKMSDGDADLGSSGPLLVPDQPGAHRHLLLQPTKNSTLYVIDRDQMGQFHSDGDAVVQVLRLGGQGAYGAIAYWNGHLFFAASDDWLRDYTFAAGHVSFRKSDNIRFENPGASPTVSANGNQNAIIWAVATKTWDGPDKPAILYAFDANQIDQPIYSSEQNAARDRSAIATRFIIPIVVNGHVYFAARGAVEVYGLLQPH
jgi:outer membrane protein assembly factor BamB